MRLKINEKLLIVDCLVCKKGEISRLIDNSHFSDFKPLYVSWFNEVDDLLKKFRKELSYEKENS